MAKVLPVPVIARPAKASFIVPVPATPVGDSSVWSSDTTLFTVPVLETPDTPTPGAKLPIAVVPASPVTGSCNDIPT